MTTTLPAPADWAPRRLVGLSLLAHVTLAACAWHYALGPDTDGSMRGHLGEGAGLLVFAVVAAIAYLRAVRQAPRLDRRFLVAGGIALACIQALAPPFVSHDLWDYLARGRLEVIGHQQYTDTVLQFRDDPRMAAFAAHAAWPHMVMPYGALMAVLQRLVALPDSPWIGLLLWKALAVAAHVGAALVMERTIADHSGPEPARTGLVLWLWNPWILLECCGSGHNEVFLVLLLALACRAALRARFGLAAAGYGFLMLVKHSCPPLAPLLLLLAIRRRRLGAFALGTAVVVIAVAIAWAHYWDLPGGLAWLGDQRNVAINSLTALSAHLLFHRAGTAVRVVGAIAILSVLVLAVRHVRDARTFARCGVLAMVAWVFAFVPSFQAWYQLWWLPLFALADAPVLARALQLLAFTGPIAYVVQVAWGFGTAHQVWLFACAGALPSLLVLGSWRELLPTRPPQP